MNDFEQFRLRWEHPYFKLQMAQKQPWKWHFTLQLRKVPQKVRATPLRRGEVKGELLDVDFIHIQ